MRSTQRLASVAVSENCQYGTPNRRWSSAPTAAASSVGSIVVMPPFTRRRASIASRTTAGEWPVMAPVSPRQKSM